MGPFWEYWYFHIPNYVLAALMYTLIGRLALSLFVPPDWENYIWKNFCRLTDPVLSAVSYLTPRAMPALVLLPLAVVWLLLLRMLLLLALAKIGLAPTVEPVQ